MKIKQQRKPKFSTQAYTRCNICGRPHSVLRKYGICRVCYVLLNKAGGYRRGQVIIRQLQVIDVVFEEEKTKTDQPVRNPANNPDSMPPTPPAEEEDEPMPENFGLIAFSWVEAHVMELNDLCNEAIAEGLSEYLIPADELPVSESWEEVCKVLIRNDFHSAQCCDEGIIIEFEQ